MFDAEQLSRLSESVQSAADALRAMVAESGRQQHSLRTSLREVVEAMEQQVDSDPHEGLTGHWAGELRKILNEESDMQSSNFGRGVETGGASTAAEKTRARLDDVNQSTRPGDRTLADIRREQRDHA